ncbi:hypothetical protein DSCO28_46330 [Desulfosarcina ovata subsp. sediminis]|uniref:Uncharacterized protein n=1 Tax=Desulfosarcina ovata subsp. sediminis TaxID=885957 RepID=A0A5K7ZUZ9_9BACT|nr:hypothetical protein [Desulfosarcina ovata]BBO84067.1 hypothetical protein DSCO28_46330 [Desulfosarcina ovata subsp. sediminis]
MNQAYNDPAIPHAHGQSRSGLPQNRLRSFGLTMIVMGASFMLYYLGLFGSVEGPLTPDKIGMALSTWGVTQRHVIITLLSVLIGALSWNWIFNLTSLAIGSRLTCTASGKGTTDVCGGSVKRIRRVSKRSGKTVVEYVCAHGHRQSSAHFHPLKKGAVSYTVCLACGSFVLIALFCV